MSSENGELQCRATTQDGEPCSAPPWMVDPAKELCRAHDPERADERKRAARKGGQATARKHRGEFSPEELPELESPADAERWIAMTARAVVEGRLSHRRADLVRKGLKVWLKAHDQGRLDEKFNRLVDGLENYRESGDPKDLLSVVDGELS